MKTTYLDYAAATPLDPQVLAAMQPYLTDQFYNPSATYLAAKAVAKDKEAARARVAHWFGARPTEVIFTSGGTEANNLAIQGVMQALPGKKVLVSSIEHESVLAPAHQYNAAEIPVTTEGIVDLQILKTLLDNDTVLVSVMYANNEIGTIQPIREVAKLLKETRKQRQKDGNQTPLYLHVDACQAPAYLDIHASRLGADMITINAGKIYGPKQSGALYVKAGTQLHPQLLGGGQERGMRSGTESVAQMIGLAEALDLVQNRRHQEVKRLQTLQAGFIKDIQQAIPTVIINGSLKHRLPNNVHITIPYQDKERLLMALDEAGIMAAAGSACSASKEESSHVLKALGKTDQEAYASLRFSFGCHTTEAELQQTVKVITTVLAA
jgi:cysteine desulfurase